MSSLRDRVAAKIKDAAKSAYERRDKVDTIVRPRNPAIGVPARQGVKVERSILINRKPEEVYRSWCNLAGLPRFMPHLERVQPTGDRQSHWVAKGPLGATVEWDAEVINERENELIAWRSLEGSQVDTAGSVHFRKDSDGQRTELKVSLKYNPPGGKLGAAVAKLFGQAPEQQIQRDLCRFKEIIEAGLGEVGTARRDSPTKGDIR